MMDSSFRAKTISTTTQKDKQTYDKTWLEAIGFDPKGRPLKEASEHGF